MKGARAQVRNEWVEAHVAEATRLAALLGADVRGASRTAEESFTAALQGVSGARDPARLADAVLAQLVRRSRSAPADPGDPDEPEQITALRALPHRQRAAVVLRHYAELTDERAATFLGCSTKAVADLARKGVAALPADARADVTEWLDGAGAPPAAAGTRRVLRRSARRRMLRLCAVAAAVAAIAAAGLRLPDALRAPERPDGAERLIAIRREIDAREAELPFDPDDAGAGATRLFPVDNGVIDGNLWSVRGYRDAADNFCLQLVVDYEFGSRRCMTASSAPVHALVEIDEGNRVTFVSGSVAPEVDTLYFAGAGVTFMDVTIGHEDPDGPRGPGFFGIALPDYLVPIESRRAGRDLGYRVVDATLTALDARERPVAELQLFLARRR